MPTIHQLTRGSRQRILSKTKSPALRACPQRRGVCTRVYLCVARIGFFSYPFFKSRGKTYDIDW